MYRVGCVLRAVCATGLWIAGAVVAGAAFAVPPGGVSATAALTCEMRALAALHVDLKLRGGDLFAGRFCASSRLPREYEAARDVIDTDLETYEAFFYVNARTRHIDARLEQAVMQGAVQVVVLGAGFDSRAYRFHEKYPKLAFFEVDLPATIAAKKDAVRRVLGGSPDYVRYAPIDFNTQSLADVLASAGYDGEKKTFFVLEGVSMYVVESGVGATLDFIARQSARGSRVVYDYIWRRVAQGDYTGLYAARKTATGVASLGEPFVTGWSATEAKAFAERHGLRVLDNLGSAELTRLYLIGSDGKPDGRLAEWIGIIEAVVP